MSIDQLKAPDNPMNGVTMRDSGTRNDGQVDETGPGLATRKINHDLRNMLTCAQLLSDRLAQVDDPTVQRLAPKLTASLERAIALCTTSRNDAKASKPLPQRQRLSLAPLVNEVANALDLGHGDICWKNNVLANVEIDADPDDLFRVLLNLCGNAILALEGPGFRYKEIRVDARRSGSGCTIDVRDTGLGVPEAALKHLFRSSQGTTRPNGSGLGLAITADLVRAHGGDISLVHGLAEGACFRVTIPDTPPAAESNAAAMVEAPRAVVAE
ncbi:sensor histidine kinase [Roseovarius nitratireducens]|uniref:sensor histidine kinase n=1 Tax=Roseovarius nitratireducens TaxID=2044597 RepID=UPI000CE1CEFB|nr:HAMP domain-containing sensor histidine kinase [Roseovarius nitratireducens]